MDKSHGGVARAHKQEKVMKNSTEFTEVTFST